MANSPATLQSQDRSGCYYLHYFALYLYLPVLSNKGVFSLDLERVHFRSAPIVVA